MTDTFFSELSDAEAYFQEDRSDDEYWIWSITF